MTIEIANRLVKLRKEKGLSQEELADKLGLSRQAVSKWERAEASPDTDNLICLAKLYGVSLDDLLNTDDTIETIVEEQVKDESEQQTTDQEAGNSTKKTCSYEKKDDTIILTDNDGKTIEISDAKLINIENNDLVLIISGKKSIVKNSLGKLRIKVANDLGLVDNETLRIQSYYNSIIVLPQKKPVTLQFIFKNILFKRYKGYGAWVDYLMYEPYDYNTLYFAFAGLANDWVDYEDQSAWVYTFCQSDYTSLEVVNDMSLLGTVENSGEGSYYNRMNKTIGLLLDGRFETNLTVTKMDENTGVVRLSSMGYDSQSYSGGDYSKMYEELKTNLQSLKDEGVTNLIFDLRSNTGGSPQFDNVIFRLILPEGEYPMNYNCLWDEAKNAFMIDDNTGKYVVGDPIMATGEDFWGQGKIVVLVNANTISAGDLFTEVMSRFDNVTIMGITPSNCSCQAIKAIEVGNGLIQFSSIPNLTENGDFYIDCDSTRKATIPLDERIEINQEFIDEIFNKGTDYILDQAVEYCQ